MRLRISTRDGTVVVVDEADLELVTAYLVLCGYPPLRVEAANAAIIDLPDTPRGP